MSPTESQPSTAIGLSTRRSKPPMSRVLSVYSPLPQTGKDAPIPNGVFLDTRRRTAISRVFSNKWTLRLATAVMVAIPALLLVSMSLPFSTGHIAAKNIVETTRLDSHNDTNIKNLCNSMLSVPRNERCAYVLANCLTDTTGFIRYNEIYYCHLQNSPIVGFILLITLAAYIFMFLGVASGEFFCPNLSNLVDWFQLPESVAGITLASLGNGAPDLFSTFTAFNANSPGLAIGELLGAAMFLTLACAGSVAIIKPFTLKRSAIREVVCFIGALIILFYIAYNRTITLFNSMAMITYYVAYVSGMIFLEYRRHRTTEYVAEVKPPQIVILPDPNASPSEHVQSFVEQNVEDLSGVYYSDPTTPTGGPSLSQESTHSLLPSDAFSEFNNLADVMNSSVSSSPILSLKQSQSMKNLYRSPSLDDHSTESRSAEPSLRRHSRSRGSSMDFRLDAGNRRVPGHRESRRSSISVVNLFSDSNTVDVEPTEFATFFNPRIIIPQRTILRSGSVSNAPFSSLRSASPLSHNPTDGEHNIRDYFAFPSQQRTPSPLRSGVPSVSASEQVSGLFSGQRYEEPDESVAGSLTSMVDRATSEGMGTFIVTENTVGYIASRYFPVVSNWDYMDLMTKVRGILLTPTLLALLVTVPVVHIEDTLSDFKQLDRVQSAIQISLLPPLVWLFLASDKNRFGTVDVIPDIYFTFNVEVPIIVLFTMVGAMFGSALLFFTAKNGKPVTISKLGYRNANIDGGGGLGDTGLSADEDRESEVLTEPLLSGSPDSGANADQDTYAYDINSFSRLLAVCGFLSSLLWIYSITNELVGIFKTLVSITGISETVMGLTLFAIGTSIGDFVTNTAIAGIGYPSMAFSACFGSPMLNLVLGVGATSLYLILIHGISQYHLGNDMVAVEWCSAALVVLMIAFCVVLRFKTRYLTHAHGYTLVALWVALISSVIVLTSIY